MATAPDQPMRRNARANQVDGASGVRIFFTMALRTAFFTTALRTAFFATAFRTAFFAAPFFAGFFLAADFFLLAAFGMYRVPLNRLRRALTSAPRRCKRESTFDSFPRKSCARARDARSAVTIELSRALGRRSSKRASACDERAAARKHERLSA